MSRVERIFKEKRVIRWTLLAVIILAFILRVWGMGFGLPQKVHPDESLLVDRSIDAVANGNFKPGFYHWPSFMIYLLWFEYLAVFLIGNLTGIYSTSADIFNSYFSDPTHFFWIGRLTTTLFCIGGMGCIYLLAKKIGGIPAGLAAVVLMGFDALFVQHSRFITPDIPATCLMLWVIYRLYDYAGSGKSHLLYSAAFVGGVAMSTKYNAGLILVPVLISSCLNVLSNGAGSVRKGSNIGIRLLISIALFFIGFLIFTPYAILDGQEFVGQLISQASHQTVGHIGMETRSSALVESFKYFLTPYGLALMLLAAAGIPSLFRKKSLGVILMIVPLLYLIVLSRWVVWADRYLLYLLPFLFIPASVTLVRIGKMFVKAKLLKKAEFASMLLAFLLVLPSLTNAVKEAAELSKPDTRVVSMLWIEENIPELSLLFIEVGGPEPHYVDDVVEFGLDVSPVYFFTQPQLWLSEESATVKPMDLLRSLDPAPEFIISSGYSRDRYFKPGVRELHPELTEPWIEYYNFIDENCVEIERFEPGDEYTGPWIIIYKLPPDALSKI